MIKIDELKIGEENAVEFSLEVAQKTGSVHTAVVFSVITDLCYGDCTVTAQEVADYLELTYRSCSSIRKKFQELHDAGFLKYEKGCAKRKPKFEILKRPECDAEIDLKWRFRHTMSYSLIWLLTILENQFEALTISEIEEAMENILPRQTTHRLLWELKNLGLVTHEKNCHIDDFRAGVWELSDEAIQLLNN
ncbi:Uncharacterized protein B5E38_5016 [Bacillus cereus]|nr:Uncharacterized protein B5E38_5016 [Bacillus cereus]ARO65102.1 Uncharacterized protein B5E39_2731 [Bacillus cereus]